MPMSKFRFFISVLFLMCMSASVLTAGNIDEQTARKAATNWYRHFAPVVKRGAGVSRVLPYVFNDRTSFYICAFNQGGFVLISGHDAAIPVLGYGFDQEVPVSITHDAVKGWFDGLARQIDTLFVLDAEPGHFAEQWDRVLNNRLEPLSGTGIGPLLTTTWDQGWPYNAMCPADPSGPGGHALAGCDPIALAQLMKYH